MDKIKELSFALVVLLLVGCGPTEEQMIDAKGASALQAQGELLLDISQPDDYAELHALNSTNIPYGRLATRLAELEPYKEKGIIVIDYSGVREPYALDVLQKAGYTRVRIVKGGLMAWQAAGLPVEKPAPQQPEVIEQE